MLPLLLTFKKMRQTHIRYTHMLKSNKQIICLSRVIKMYACLNCVLSNSLGSVD